MKDFEHILVDLRPLDSLQPDNRNCRGRDRGATSEHFSEAPSSRLRMQRWLHHPRIEDELRGDVERGES